MGVKTKPVVIQVEIFSSCDVKWERTSFSNGICISCQDWSLYPGLQPIPEGYYKKREDYVHV